MARRSGGGDGGAERLAGAAAGAGADLERIGAEVERVLADELYWFGVRHHSPAAAFHLRAALRERRPKVVFLEAPAGADDLAPYVVDRATRPPVALYSSYRDDDNVLGLAGIASPSPDVPPRWSSWYPLLEYSPEYVALRTAAEIGARVVFMDLPHHALLRPAAGDAPLAAPPSPPSGGAERLIVESDFYRHLAQAAGYRTWDEAWDSLFEAGTLERGHEAFRREMAWFCAASRATSDPARIAEDGTLERERFMLQTIRRTLGKSRLAPAQGLVVCGGFHLFLDRDDPEPPPEPPPGTVYVTVVPYSTFQLSELSGYAAGNRAPLWYQACWERLDAGDSLDPVVADHAVAVLARARRAGEPVSSADGIGVVHHARLLARLRGRPRPVLDDVHDALVTCCVKGDPATEGHALAAAMDAAGIGTRVGKVTPRLGRLPLVDDFHRQAEALELAFALGREKKVTLRLDKREALAARQSVFFHRLVCLEVPLATRADPPSAGPAAGTLFRETWQLGWGPKVEPALVERSLLGDTVEAAAVARLKEELASAAASAGETCRRLVQAIAMDFPDLVARAREACGAAIDADPRLVSLAAAVVQLQVLHRHAAYQELRREDLDLLLVRAFDRACFALAGVASAPPEEELEIVGALLALVEAALGGRDDLDRGLLARSLASAAEDSAVPFLRGAFRGAAVELREASPEELAEAVAAYARETPDKMVEAGDFLDGVMAVSRAALLVGAHALIEALDQLLRAADPDAFLNLLPRLRTAFARLHERHRDSLAAQVAERYGLAAAEAALPLATSAGAAACLARVDARVAAILEDWGL